MERKYYSVGSKKLAEALSWTTGQKYLVFDDNVNIGKKLYSFENTEVFKNTIQELHRIKRENELKIK